MYVITIKEAGDEHILMFKHLNGALGFILNTFFHGNNLRMIEAEAGNDKWHCAESDTDISIEIKK